MSVALTTEEEGWLSRAEVARDGKGIPLSHVNWANEKLLEEVCEELGIGLLEQPSFVQFLQRIQKDERAQNARSSSFTRQQQQPHILSMNDFFSQNIAELKLDEDDHVAVSRMLWFDEHIASIYWRRCYSYILCSTIAFFEKAFDANNTADPNQNQGQWQSLVLTHGRGM